MLEFLSVSPESIKWFVKMPIRFVKHIIPVHYQNTFHRINVYLNDEINKYYTECILNKSYQSRIA